MTSNKPKQFGSKSPQRKIASLIENYKQQDKQRYSNLLHGSDQFFLQPRRSHTNISSRSTSFNKNRTNLRESLLEKLKQNGLPLEGVNEFFEHGKDSDKYRRMSMFSQAFTGYFGSEKGTQISK